MPYSLDLRGVNPKRISPLPEAFGGVSPNGSRLSFTNYYMELDGAPVFGVSGEFHFSRCSPAFWEDELIKMKLGGVTIVSTYLFWNHHEEIEGVFRFDGRRDLRRFIALCAKHALLVILRLGPFCHGEARNGGLPDWLYGKPFEVRSLDESFLAQVRRLYSAAARQVHGLLWKDGGPVIACQLDNEYGHSAAPWEMTAGVSDEWTPPGSDGDAYILALKRIALDVGLEVPFYTCTAWGGAAAPSDETLPLWGGYAYQPWLFYHGPGVHPATPEYLYRDNHNNGIPQTYNFAPAYPPEKMPYACCEMGGGMMCSYRYRFVLPYESVDAMANIKMASGCNFVGYYVYHGGTNPRGETAPYLNENQVCKLSYDYQAPLGEYGQARPSYHRLRALHLLGQTLAASLCPMKTVLPQGAEEIDPRDADTLRFAVRTDGVSGFLFVNNFQDHAERHPVQNASISLSLAGEPIEVDGISLAPGENAVYPFGLDLGGVTLRCATAQPITFITVNQNRTWFFLAPHGQSPRYHLSDGRVLTPPGDLSPLPLSDAVEIVTLTRAQAARFYKVRLSGRDCALLTDALPLLSGGVCKLESESPDFSCLSFPALPLSCPNAETVPVQDGVFSGLSASLSAFSFTPKITQAGPSRWVVTLPDALPLCAKDLLLSVDYTGDIGSAFLDGVLIADHFYNGAPWEIGLAEFLPTNHPLTIYITPKKEGAAVQVDSPMAARSERVDRAVAALHGVTARAVYQTELEVLP